MTILVCDDHPLVRQALCATAAGLAPDAAVRAARDFREAWAAAEDGEDEVVLCLADLHMAGADPIEGLAGLKARAPEAKIVVITGSDSDEHLLAALDLGVDGFVLKSAEPGVVEAAILLVMAGGRYLPPRVAELAATRSFVPTPEADPAGHDQAQDVKVAYRRISGRQREVLSLLAQGKANKEIARALLLSPATIKTHVASLIAALGATNRTEAVALARAGGLLK